MNQNQQILLTDLGKTAYKNAKLSEDEKQVLLLLKDSFTISELNNMLDDNADIFIESFLRRKWIELIKNTDNKNLDKNEHDQESLDSVKITNKRKTPSEKEIHDSLVDFLKLFEN